MTIKPDDFYADYNLPTPEDLDREIEKVCRDEDKKEECVKSYLKGNIPILTNRPLCPTKKYRIYTFSIRRTHSDNPISFRTIAEDSGGAIAHIEEVFKRKVTDFYYLAPKSVSDPDYPSSLLLTKK